MQTDPLNFCSLSLGDGGDLPFPTKLLKAEVWPDETGFCTLQIVSKSGSNVGKRSRNETPTY